MRAIAYFRILVPALFLLAGLHGDALSLNSFDREVMEFVDDHRSHDLDHLMSTITTEWNKDNFLAAALAITVWGNDATFVTLEECAKSAAVSELAVGPLKYATDRQRPTGKHSRAESSFPSGHAAGAFAVASTLGHIYPRLKLPLYAAATIVGYSRLYEKSHYATDVLAGACIGVLSARISRAFLTRLQLDRQDLVRRLPLRVGFGEDGRGVVRIYLSRRL